MTYRLEIDALNALVNEQKRTNELLERLIELNTTKAKTPAVTPENKTQRRGRNQK